MGESHKEELACFIHFEANSLPLSPPKASFPPKTSLSSQGQEGSKPEVRKKGYDLGLMRREKPRPSIHLWGGHEPGAGSGLLEHRNQEGCTFWPFEQVDLHDSLRWRLSPPHHQPDHRACLLQCLHRPAVHHLGHVHLIHPEHTVIHPVGKAQEV